MSPGFLSFLCAKKLGFKDDHCIFICYIRSTMRVFTGTVFLYFYEKRAFRPMQIQNAGVFRGYCGFPANTVHASNIYPDILTLNTHPL